MGRDLDYMVVRIVQSKETTGRAMRRRGANSCPFAHRRNLLRVRPRSALQSIHPRQNSPDLVVGLHPLQPIRIDAMTRRLGGGEDSMMTGNEAPEGS